MTEPCLYDPTLVRANSAIGMFHCPYCGQMVVAGLPHPNYADVAIYGGGEIYRPIDDESNGEKTLTE